MCGIVQQCPECFWLHHFLLFKILLLEPENMANIQLGFIPLLEFHFKLLAVLMVEIISVWPRALHKSPLPVTMFGVCFVQVLAERCAASAPGPRALAVIALT